VKKTVYIASSQFCERDQTPMQRLLEAGFEVRRNSLGRRLKSEEMLPEIGSAEAVIAGLETYDSSILEALPGLRCISRCGVGTDTIDLDAAARRRIAIFTTPDEVGEAAAQLAVAMIFALSRNFPQHASDLRSGLWRKHEGHLLSEWTIGIVGFGRIGRLVHKYLRPFGPRILIADPAVRQQDVPPDLEVCDLAGVLKRSDLVTLHASRRAEEGPLLDRQAFKEMKSGIRIVNTARGYLIDELALYDALRSGNVAGAAHDVYATEPYCGPLVEMPQVLCTPHIATMTGASRGAMERRAAENVVAFLSRSS
jgi:D-3-phosphoglycerate dehydrogenase / 2-oxoglutarate reductase